MGEKDMMAAEIPAPVPQWVMVCRTGQWLGHPDGPELITPRHLRAALDYFERHHAARGADLVIDYHHGSVYAGRVAPKAPAAGWIQQLQLRNGDTELWGRVLWTVEAREAIAARQFRYLSPYLRFGVPDRITGEPVPMMIHSVALTNTPFLTELEALNASAGNGAGALSQPVSGGGDMAILKQVAQALNSTPEDVASRLGLDAGADDRRVAEAIMEGAAANGAAAVLPEGVANALGVEPDADEAAVRARILQLKAPAAGLASVRRALGLEPTASEQAVLNAIVALRQDHRKREAQALVDEAVKAGKIPPAHREFFLNSALDDLEATKMCLADMPCLLSSQTAGMKADLALRGLTEGEELVCRQLGIGAEAFLKASQ